MKVTKNRSWIHKARKDRRENSKEDVDLMRKNKVIKALWPLKTPALGLIPNVYMRDRLTNETTISSVIETDLDKTELWAKYDINLPDLYVKKLDVIIEIDGPYHGDGPESPITDSAQTERRNANYKLGGYTTDNGKLIIYTNKDVDDRTVEELTEDLRTKLGL